MIDFREREGDLREKFKRLMMKTYLREREREGG